MKERKLHKMDMCLKIATKLNSKKHENFVQTDNELAKFIMRTYSIGQVKNMYNELNIEHKE